MYYCLHDTKNKRFIMFDKNKNITFGGAAFAYSYLSGVPQDKIEKWAFNSENAFWSHIQACELGGTDIYDVYILGGDK